MSYLDISVRTSVNRGAPMKIEQSDLRNMHRLMCMPEEA